MAAVSTAEVASITALRWGPHSSVVYYHKHLLFHRDGKTTNTQGGRREFNFFDVRASNLSLSPEMKKLWELDFFLQGTYYIPTYSVVERGRRR